MAQTELRYSSEEIVWQEVPGETSLAYTITGCTVGCKGCHSVDTWPKGSGIPLTASYFEQRLAEYRGLITCVLFLGGEWHPEELIQLLQISQQNGLKTCLYTGLEQVLPSIQKHLDYLKTGPWIAELGGLNSPTTNQRFFALNNHALNNQALSNGSNNHELLNVKFLQ